MDPAGRAYSASQTPLAGYKETAAGKGKKKREKKGQERREAT